MFFFLFFYRERGRGKCMLAARVYAIDLDMGGILSVRVLNSLERILISLNMAVQRAQYSI